MGDDESVALALDFLLRDPSTDHATACSILAALPFPFPFHNNNHQSLCLAVLLQSLRHELARPSLSDRILALLHSLLSLIPRAPLRPAAAAAFLAVGVEAAAKHLRTRPPDLGEFKLAVRRVWKMRARRVAASDPVLASCLLSHEFTAAKRELVAAMGNDVVRRGLMERDTKGAAVEAVGRFLEAAEIELGPPALVYVSQVMADGFLQHSNDDDCTLPLSPPDKVFEIPACDEAITIEPDLNLASDKPDEFLARENRFAEDGLKDAKCFSQNDPVPGDEVKKTLNELRLSAKDLKSVVEDPLPSVLDLLDNMVKCQVAAQSSRSCLEGNNHLNERPQIPSLGDDVSAVKKFPAEVNENQNGPESGLTLKVDKLKQTAQTYQWSDDSFSSNSPGRKIRLPSAKKRVVSPLKVEAGYKRRRIVKRWSSVEEETLKTAVQEYGRGNWKVILKKYGEIFADRTEIDLKDKWRNMCKL